MNSKKKQIVALTACPVGVAHTYIAQDKLEQAAKSLGYDIKVETHGSIGIKGTLTAKDILEADLVIIATAAGASDLKLERFQDKPLYKVEIAKVIKDPEGIINEAFKTAKPFEAKNRSTDKNKKDDKSTDIFSTDKTGIMKHVMAGVGYMVPFVVFGGIMIALSAGIGQAIYGPGVSAPYGNFLWFMNQAGSIGFALMIPILAGFIANSIAGRAALAPAMISAFIANTTVVNGVIPDPHNAGQFIPNLVTLVFPINGLGTSTPAGFLGALLIGPVVGYLVKWIITWKVPKSLAPVMPIFFIPILVTFIVSFTFIYGIGAPIGWVMSQFANGLKELAKYQAAMGAIGLLLGAMVGFDMGGPVNKVAFLVATTTINVDPTKGGGPETALFMGAIAAGIPVAPLGMGLSTLLFRKNFNENERSLGITAMILGFIGISEGAIPFAIRDPKRAIIANIIGSAVAGSIAGALLLTDVAAHGGPIVAILGAVGALNYSKGVAIALFFLAIVVGTAVTCLVYGGLLIIKSKNIRVFKSISDKFSKTKSSKNKDQEIKHEPIKKKK